MPSPHLAGASVLSLLPEDHRFIGPRGETCVRLLTDFTKIFAAIGGMGPLLIGVRRAGLTAMVWRLAVQLHPVPGLPERVEPDSGWLLGLNRIDEIVAVEEPWADGRVLTSLQFFDAEGCGVAKILLTPDSDWQRFHRLVRCLALPSTPPWDAVGNPAPAPAGHPESPMANALLRLLMDAHFLRFPLVFTLHEPGQYFPVVVTPHRLERDRDAVMLCDPNAEIHIECISSLDIAWASPRPDSHTTLPGLLLSDGGSHWTMEYAGPERLEYLWMRQFPRPDARDTA